MNEIKLTKVQLEEATKLNTGKVIYAYRDGNAVRCETERGVDPYVWRGGRWKRMCQRPL